MPTLNDYIGSLVSSITNARAMSDLQTVKIAEEYANHKLLQHFSVPRMRIEDIEMTIPVGLNAVNEKQENYIEPIDAKAINSLMFRLLLSNTGINKLKTEVAKSIQTEIAKQTGYLEVNINFANNITVQNIYVKAITDYYFIILKKNDLLTKEQNLKLDLGKISNTLLIALKDRIKIKEKNTGIGYLDVIVEASKLREVKPENLIYIKVKIKEDGMEWNRLENNNGDIISKLLPE